MIMVRKFFVTVFTPNRRALLNLGDYYLDLFQATAQVSENQEFIIEGLLTLEEIGENAEFGQNSTLRLKASCCPKASPYV
jgi:hypothetical protein